MRIAFVGDSLTRGIPGSSYVSILREWLPDHTLINLGKPNDTVISLYRRIAYLNLHPPVDIAFLWVGVNDVHRRASLTFRIANALLRKTRAESDDAFRTYYRWALDRLDRAAGRVLAVSPTLHGENLDNGWNRELGCLSQVIEELAARDEKVEYLDLRALFHRRLDGRHTSDYLPRSVLSVAWDALTLRSQAQVDAKSSKRGLHLTLDGIHLNSAGAELVAGAFLERIRG